MTWKNGAGGDESLRAKRAHLNGLRALAHIDSQREVIDKLLAIADELAEENQRLRAELDALKQKNSAGGQRNGNF